MFRWYIELFWWDFCNIFFRVYDFVFTLLCETDFCFHEKELGVYVVDWFTGITYYYKYELCLNDIFNCFGEIFAIFVPSLDTS